MKPILLSLIFGVHFCVLHAQTPTASEDTKDKDLEISNILNSMGYPELQVVPRASERLRMEARDENSNWWIARWPMQISGLTTLLIGLEGSKNRREDLSSTETSDAKTLSLLTQAVGLSWLAAGVIIGSQRPYATGARAIGKIGGKDERATLMRERLAEEYLERPAKVMRVLQHIAVMTNFTMNAANVYFSDNEGKVKAGVAAIVAFLPYMFEDNSIAVFNKHIEYKKKIFSPIKSASFHFDPVTNSVTPMSTLVWTF